MADKSPIEWTDATWNPIVGCSIVSPGCTHCYAMKMAGRIEAMGGAKHYAGTTKKVNGNTVWTGKLALAPESTLLQPLAWKRPRRIFVNSMGDLFHEDVPDEWIDKVFAVMALAPQHTFQVLTKRAKRMREYFAETWQRPARAALTIDGMTIPAQPAGTTDRWHQIDLAIDRVTDHEMFDEDRFWTTEGSLIGRPAWPRQPLPNVWLGVSAERRQEADERVPDLLATPAAIRFVSAEPLLGLIYFTRLRPPQEKRLYGFPNLDALRGSWFVDGHTPKDDDALQDAVRLDWVIVGGESGPDARPMHPDWAREIRHDCAAAGVPFFFKQWGAWADSTEAPDLVDGSEDFIFASDGTVLGAGGRIGRKMNGIVEHDWRERGGAWMTRTNKKAAGRLLDGVEHNGMPEMREVLAL